MIRTTIVLIAAAFALAGCADPSLPIIQSRLGDLKGEPVSTVVERLGAPAEQIKNGDDRTYVWYGTHKPRTSALTGYYECTIKVFADEHDKITGVFYAGSNAGCSRYAHRLDNNYPVAHIVFGL